MKSIPAILDILDPKLREYTRVEALGPSTEAEIAKVLEGSALDDPKVSARLSELRTIVELVPVKLRQLDAEIAAHHQELEPAIAATARLLNQIAHREEGEQKQKILTTLRGLLPELQEDDSLVGQVYVETPAYRNRISQLSVSNSTYGNPEQKARELVVIARKQNIDISGKLPEPPAQAEASESSEVSREEAEQAAGESEATETGEQTRDFAKERRDKKTFPNRYYS